MNSDWVGRLLAERYALVAEIGHGGMGQVFRAIDRENEAEVAIKILRSKNAQDHQDRERFEREIRISATLQHDYLVRVRGTGYDEVLGLPFLVMDLMHGMDLRKFLQEKGPLSPQAAIALMLQVGKGLNFLHKRRLVHRDIKPANIFLETYENEIRAILCDLGIAKQAERNDQDPTLTSTDSVVGSVKYMPPEYVQKKEFDERSDLYSLNATFYEILGGRAVWHDHSSNAEIVAALVRDEVPPLSRHAPWISEELVRAVHRGLARDPRERYSSCQEWMTTLAALGEPRSLHNLEDLRLRDEERSLVGASTESLLLPQETTKTSLRKSDNKRWLAGALALMILVFFGTRFSRERIHREPLANLEATSSSPRETTVPGAASTAQEVLPESSSSPPLPSTTSPSSPSSNKAKEAMPKATTGGTVPRQGLAQEKVVIPSNQPPTSSPPPVQPRQEEPKKPDINQPLYGKDAW